MYLNTSRITYILWTGGWDSTFRILQLAYNGTEDDIIQPIYVKGDNRKSENLELKAMRDILLLIRNISSSQIRDVILVDKKSIESNINITEAYNRINKSVSLGSQYEYLARLAIKYPGIEIGIEKPNGEFSGCIEAIERNGGFIERKGSYFIDASCSSDDCVKVFGNFSFPLRDLTEVEMVTWVKERNLMYIMEHIWFCHKPIDGVPCGICRPCQQKMECNMEWLLPLQSQSRYYIYTRLNKVLGPSLGRKIGGRLLRIIK